MDYFDRIVGRNPDETFRGGTPFDGGKAVSFDRCGTATFGRQLGNSSCSITLEVYVNPCKNLASAGVGILQDLMPDQDFNPWGTYLGKQRGSIGVYNDGRLLENGGKRREGLNGWESGTKQVTLQWDGPESTLRVLHDDTVVFERRGDFSTCRFAVGGLDVTHRVKSMSGFKALAETPRGSRRVETNRMQLYHCTNRTAANQILSQQKMLRGGGGTAGGGIYFAKTAGDARRKSAHGNDVCLQADVWMGNVKVVNIIDPTLTFTNLQGDGFDSVRLTCMNGDECIVYNYDQVESISEHAGTSR